MGAVFTLARALTYATVFVGLLLVSLPARLLDATGVTRPATLGGVEIAAIYEEPTLGREFDGDYEAYRARVSRWLPRRERLPGRPV